MIMVDNILSDEVKTQSITLTGNAVSAVKQILAERNLENHALRIYVAGRTCSGFQYGLALEKNIREQDTVAEFEDVKVVIDEVSLPYLLGCMIDYIDNAEGQGFKIENPNLESSCSGDSCGCGGGCC